ncbi:MAG: class I SAM-dependent methyltransferase [Myxococcota bacterium]|nr:class I SAM-dependent methyltransferase [Myxococcota bacterium]
MKQHAPATARNRDAIREVLARHLPASGVVLEIASGTGEHAVHFARAFPELAWQPTDPDDRALASIEAWRADADLANLRPAVRLDVCDEPWPVSIAEAITCINMIHIAPWEATLALFAGARRTLPAAGLLYTYGPYRFDGLDGHQTAPSNEDFDRSLKSRDPRWGVRDLAALRTAAAGAFELVDVIAMPANNHSLIWRRAAT